MLKREKILGKDRALICFFQNGCSRCLEVELLTELLAKTDMEVVKVDCDESDELLFDFGGDGTPYWCLIQNGEMVKGICPTDSREALYSFITEDGKICLSREEFDSAMDAGKEKRELHEMAVAEILFRSKDSDEDSLLYAAKLKIIRPCIMAESDEALRSCIREKTRHFMERLNVSMENEGGDTPVRRSVLKKLPGLEEKIFQEIHAYYENR